MPTFPLFLGIAAIVIDLVSVTSRGGSSCYSSTLPFLGTFLWVLCECGGGPRSPRAVIPH
jgi:hypothetical protein